MSETPVKSRRTRKSNRIACVPLCIRTLPADMRWFRAKTRGEWGAAARLFHKLIEAERGQS